jgi:di/tricarboxylate transporter
MRRLRRLIARSPRLTLAILVAAILAVGTFIRASEVGIAEYLQGTLGLTATLVLLGLVFALLLWIAHGLDD